MCMWTRTLVVVYRVYYGHARMETGKASRSLVRGGSMTWELDATGQREREREWRGYAHERLRGIRIESVMEGKVI
jgi:hypothetical protein